MRVINRSELFTSKLVSIHDLPDRLDNPLDPDAIYKTQARPPVDREKGVLAIRSSELSPLQPGFAAADRTDPPDRLVGSADSKALCSTGSYTRPPVDQDKGELVIQSSELSPLQPGVTAADRIDPPDRLVGSVDSKALCSTGSYTRPPADRDKGELAIWSSELSPLPPRFAAADCTDPSDRLVGSVDSKALCSTGSYARPPVERDKSDSGLVDADRFQVPLIFTAAASVDSQDLLVLKLALDHTFESQGRPPVERDKTELTIWKGDDRKTCFFKENGGTPTAGIPEEADTSFEGDPVGGPSASGE